MSSHHIVRENQEPALLVEDFHALSDEYLGQLLEWSPTLITTTNMLNNFLTQEIKVDMVYGNESITAQAQIKTIPATSSFWKDALTYLVDNNYKAVNILAKELDDSFLAYAWEINIVVFVNGMRYVLVRNRYEKWKAAGQKMFINPSNVKSFNGLQYIDKDTFEVEQDGFVIFEMNSDQFVFLGEEI